MFGKKKQSEQAEMNSQTYASEQAQKKPKLTKEEKKARRKAQRTSIVEDIKAIVHKKGFKIGTYTAGATAIVLAILVVINLLVSTLPEKFTEFDLSGSDLYDLAEQTETVVGGLENDVTIYWIVQDNNEDSTLEKTLARYEDLSKHITIEKIDPVENPNFAYQYTSDDIYNNSLVVKCEATGKSRYVSYYDIYESSYDENYNTVTEYNGEGELTSAINFVTSDEMATVYYLSGHGEEEIPDNLTEALTNENISLESLNLLTEDSVPEDCKALLIYSPASDISKDEVKKIESYLESNGNLMLFTDCEHENLTNLESIMEDRGVTAVDGMVVESNKNYYMSNYPNYLVPAITSHDITDPIIDGNYRILMPIAQGLEVTNDSDDDVEVDVLLSTTSEAYSKADGVNATKAAFEDGDIESDGGFALAVAITDQTDTGEAKIVWTTSTSLISEQIDQLVSGADMDFVTNAFGWLCEMEDTISIHAKTISYDYLTLTSAQSGRWTMLMVIVIPLGTLIAGIVVWLKRRKK